MVRRLRRGATDRAEQARRLAGLVQEHRDLDGAISALFAAGNCDPLVITRLKKRKLQLKDEIARIEDRTVSAPVQRMTTLP